VIIDSDAVPGLSAHKQSVTHASKRFPVDCSSLKWEGLNCEKWRSAKIRIITKYVTALSMREVDSVQS